MKIAGIQKMSLLDYPGHIAATVFTPGCDMRCPFCHNAELVNESNTAEYYESEVLEFLAQRKGKLEGVAITGGEPLMQSETIDFIRKLKAMGFLVKLDTNGSYPERLSTVLSEKLADYIAMDIKNVPSKWAQTTGLTEAAAAFMYEKCLKSMQLLEQSGIEFEYRTTIVKEFHKPDDMAELAQIIKNAPHFYMQSFKDSGKTLVQGLHPHDRATIYKMLESVREIYPAAQLRGVD